MRKVALEEARVVSQEQAGSNSADALCLCHCLSVSRTKHRIDGVPPPRLPARLGRAVLGPGPAALHGGSRRRRVRDRKTRRGLLRRGPLPPAGHRAAAAAVAAHRSRARGSGSATDAGRRAGRRRRVSCTSASLFSRPACPGRARRRRRPGLARRAQRRRAAAAAALDLAGGSRSSSLRGVLTGPAHRHDRPGHRGRGASRATPRSARGAGSRGPWSTSRAWTRPSRGPPRARSSRSRRLRGRPDGDSQTGPGAAPAYEQPPPPPRTSSRRRLRQPPPPPAYEEPRPDNRFVPKSAAPFPTWRKTRSLAEVRVRCAAGPHARDYEVRSSAAGACRFFHSSASF